MSQYFVSCRERFFGLGLLLAAFPVAVAFAAEPEAVARARADKVCAAYGPGFVAGAAPGQCVKAEERLRVDRGARRGMSPWEPPAAFAPLQQNDGAMNAHLRLSGGFGTIPALRSR